MPFRTEPQSSEIRSTVAKHAVLGVALTSALLLFLCFVWPMLQGRIYVHTDLGLFHVPMRHFFADSLHHDWSPIWCPYEFTGFYLQGEGQAVMSHPLNILQYRFLPFVAAFNVEHARNYVFLLLGTYFFLRRWRLRREAAVLGALLFTFSSFNFLHFMHMNFVAVAAHIPWLLLAVDVALRSPNPRNASTAWASVALLTASQLLHSHPQVTWMSLVVVGLYSAFLMGPSVFGTRPDPSPWMAVKRLSGIAVALALGFVTAAVQLLPMWESLQRSFRRDPGELFLELRTLPALGLTQLFAPWFSDGVIGRQNPEFALHSSAVAVVLVTWLLMRRAAMGESWRLGRAALALTAIGLLLSLGESGQLQRLERMLPIVGLFRAPTRNILIAQLGLCVAAAVAFADLLAVAEGRRGGVRRLWPLALPTALGIASTVLLLTGPIPTAHERLPLALISAASPALIALGPLLTALAAVLVALAARHRRLACSALLVLAASDLAAYSIPYIRDPAPVELEAWRDEAEVPDMERGLRMSGGPPRLIMKGLRLADGYAAMQPARILPIGHTWPKKPPDIHVKQALRVASVARSKDEPVSDPLPRIRLVTRAVVSERFFRDLAKLDIERVALVDRPVALGGGPTGEAQISDEVPGRIAVQTDALSNQLLVVGESLHSGWSASVDGEPCPLVRAYGDFMGCVVPAGVHEVVFRFDPASFRWGKRLSWLGLALTLLWPALVMLRLRRRGARDSAEARPTET